MLYIKYKIIYGYVINIYEKRLEIQKKNHYYFKFIHRVFTIIKV